MTRVTLFLVVVLLFTVALGYRKSQDFNVLRVEKNPDQAFQGCMLRCMDRDICCSCKESAKLSMNAAIINNFIKTCPEVDDNDCTEHWLNSWMNVEENDASNCTVMDNVSRQIHQCTSQCKERPMSKPLNPDHPLDHPGQLSELSDLLNYDEPEFNDFCKDIRVEGILCTVWSSSSYTAGNTRCREGNVCGKHGQDYTWCYTDAGDSWDYCCTDTCDFHGYDYLWCHSGPKWQYCGKGLSYDVDGRKCVSSFPCGMHQEVSKSSYYWCYVDHAKNWGRCCEPWDPCTPEKKHHASGCYTGYKKKSNWSKCKIPAINEN